MKKQSKNFDNTDKMILGILKKNSRQSLRRLGRELKLRPSTVFRKIQRLKAMQAIKSYTIRINNSAIGEEFVGFVLVSTKEELPASFFGNPNLKEAYGITGEYDLLLKYRFQNVQGFNNALLEFRKLKHITKTHSMIATIELKEET